nr:glycosyltransferase [Acetomicrobium sp.]
MRGLAKYLPEFGWDPVILTPVLPGEPDQRFQVVQTPFPGDVVTRLKKRLHLSPDKGLSEQPGIPLAIREGKLTRRIWTFVRAFIAYPDEYKDWYHYGVKTGHNLLREMQFDALLSSSGPVTTHLIAKELKMRNNIPWIADFRDLWTLKHHYPYGPLRKWFDTRLELKTISWADALVTVSEPEADKQGSLHRGKPVFAIPNGFDLDEVTQLQIPLTKEFTITYTGTIYNRTIYGNKQNPTPLLRALRELIVEGLINPDITLVRFFGPPDYWLEREIINHNLGDIVKQYGTVPRDVALARQRESQILLLLNWDDPREVGVYTGKLFEYLAAKRPILAIGGPKGVVSELLEETGAGVHVNSIDDLKVLLKSWYREYQLSGEVGYNADWNMVQKYSHREMARKFAEVLDGVVDK